MEITKEDLPLKKKSKLEQMKKNLKRTKVDIMRPVLEPLPNLGDMLSTALPVPFEDHQSSKPIIEYLFLLLFQNTFRK
jgi:hypothetical protein